MHFRDLGTLGVEVGGVWRTAGGKKPSVILNLLLVNAGRRVSVDAIVEAVWEADASPRVASSLESQIWRLRRLLEPQRVRREAPQVLVNDSSGYRLEVTADQVDSLCFEQLDRDSRRLMQDGAVAPGLARVDAALALWRGRPYEPFSEEIWAVTAVTRLEEIEAQLRTRRVEALVELGDHEAALADLEQLLGQWPYREPLWAHRMRALHLAGRTEDALRSFQRARALLDEMGLEPGVELQELQRRILQQDASLIPKAAAAAGPSPSEVGPDLTNRAIRLPHPRTPLIGRAHESAQLAGLVMGHGLVTITGAGGCGKTRLSIDVARAVAEHFPDGVWFIDLTSVDDADRVIDLVVSTIGIAAPAPGTVFDVLHSYIRDRRMLLVLDNCEHLLDGVDELLQTVLEDAADCAVLATSREPLMVDGEVIWTLGPLPLPAVGVKPRAAGSPADSVALFGARMRAAAPHLVTDQEGERTIEEICVAVDGIPLAIELAAARARTFTLAEILVQVTTDPTSLARIGRGRDDHRRTLGDTIDWSHRLLTPQEQAVHRRLAVLPGGFSVDLAAAVVVGAAEAGSVAAVGDLLASLAHKSMLVVRPPIFGRRNQSTFNQLATVRAHARGALQAAGETSETQGRRDAWVFELLTAAPRIRHADDGWYDEVEYSYSSVRATLQRVLVEDPDPRAAAILTRLSMFWYYRDYMLEGERWVSAALDMPGVDPHDAQLLRLELTGILTLRGRLGEALAHLASAMEPGLPDDVGRLEPIAEHLSGIALSLLAHERLELVPQLLAHVRTAADRVDDDDLRLLADGLKLLVRLDQRRITECAVGAADLYDRSLAGGNLLAAWTAAGVQTAVARATRQPVDGIAWSSRTLRLVGKLGCRQLNVFLETRASFTALAGRPEDAVRLYAAARVRAQRAGMPWPRRPRSLELLEQARAELDETAFAQADREGETLRTDEVLRLSDRTAPAP